MQSTVHHDYFKALYTVAKTVNSTLDLKTVLNACAESTAQTLGFKGCSIRLLDQNRERLVLAAHYGLSHEYLEKGPVFAGRSLSEVLQGKSIAIMDAKNDPRAQYPEAAAKEGIASILGVPLVARDNIIGVMRVYTATLHEFTDEEIEFLQAAANLSALAIQNATLYDHIKREVEELRKGVDGLFGYLPQLEA